MKTQDMTTQRYRKFKRGWGMGHNSKAVHRAYAKHAEVTVPSLADWEKDWQENPQCNAQRKLLPVDFRPPLATAAQTNWNRELTLIRFRRTLAPNERPPLRHGERK